MGGVIFIMSRMRSTLSKSNESYISKFRFLELKNFCMQYKEWKSELSSINLYMSAIGKERVNTSVIFDPVTRIVMKRDELKCKIDLVERTAVEIDEQLAAFILLGVTEDIGYNYLRTKLGIPCSKKTYYARYHKFFKLLDERR